MPLHFQSRSVNVHCGYHGSFPFHFLGPFVSYAMARTKAVAVRKASVQAKSRAMRMLTRRRGNSQVPSRSPVDRFGKGKRARVVTPPPSTSGRSSKRKRVQRKSSDPQVDGHDADDGNDDENFCTDGFVDWVSGKDHEIAQLKVSVMIFGNNVELLYVPSHHISLQAALKKERNKSAKLSATVQSLTSALQRIKDRVEVAYLGPSGHVDKG